MRIKRGLHVIATIAAMAEKESSANGAIIWKPLSCDHCDEKIPEFTAACDFFHVRSSAL